MGFDTIEINLVYIMFECTVSYDFLFHFYSIALCKNMLPDPTKKKGWWLWCVMFQGLLCQGNHFTLIMSKLCIFILTPDYLMCWYVWSQTNQSSARCEVTHLSCVYADFQVHELGYLQGAETGGSCIWGVGLFNSQYFRDKNKIKKNVITKVTEALGQCS